MISISDLHFGYTTEREILHGVDLTLPSGSIYGLLGKNGAGKTSLIKNITGLRRPSAGEIESFGYNPSLREREYVQKYFFIPEDPYIPNISMKEYIGRYAPFYPDFDLEKFFKLLREFELERSLHLRNLSFGQKKKSLIAFAIATNTPLLIMDEPTNGLDIPSKKQFRKIISYIAEEDRLFLISTHQIRDLHSLIDHVVLIDDGRIILDRDMLAISEALIFEVHRQEPIEDDILYHERVPGGYLSIRAGSSMHSLEVDLEVLFNAVITDRQLFSKLLNGQAHV